MRVSTRFALVIAVAVPMLFLSEMVVLNRVPEASDTVARYPINEWAGSYSEREKDTPQWFPHLFGGMPSYAGYINTYQGPLNRLLGSGIFNKGVLLWFHFMIGGVGVFVLLRRKKLSNIAACFGALVYSVTPYLFGLINAGHTAKIIALGFLPFVILSFDHVLSGATWKGILYLGISSAMQLWSNHPQIVYYSWMLALFLFFWRQVKVAAIGRWSFKQDGAQIGAVLAGIVLATLLASEPYFSVLQFQSHSTRGAPSVLDQSGDSQRGTDWDYATQWSFHPKEMISFVYPYFYGLQNYPTRDLKTAAYWGHMPFTQSTHYLGLLTVLLAILGLTMRKPDSFTLSMIVTTAFIIVIGFGRYFPILFWPLFKFAPFFGKFRIPSMIYVLLPLTVGTVAAGGLDTVMTMLKDGEKETRTKLKVRTLIIFGAVISATVVLFILGKSGYSALSFFVKTGDPARLQPEVLAQLENVRLEIFQKGLLLALFISAAGLAAIWLGWRGILKGESAGLMLLGLLTVDLWLVDKEFLHLKNPGDMRQQFRATQEVKFLKQDEGLYRILPLDDFNTNWYAYFGLSSVGGYRPVKLRTYQDLMDAGGLGHAAVLNMLNVRYVITRRDIESDHFRRVFSGEKSVYQNMSALPRAWTVGEITSVADQRESLEKTLDPEFDPSETAVVVDYRGPAPSPNGVNPVQIIRLSENEIVLETSTEGGRLLVLSENYYGPGWNAWVNGKEARIYQTNHVLRSVYVPPGDHTVTFQYDTTLFRTSRLISRLSLLGVLMALVFLHRNVFGSMLFILRKRG